MVIHQKILKTYEISSKNHEIAWNFIKKLPGLRGLEGPVAQVRALAARAGVADARVPDGSVVRTLGCNVRPQPCIPAGEERNWIHFIINLYQLEAHFLHYSQQMHLTVFMYHI